jgi:transposase
MRRTAVVNQIRGLLLERTALVAAIGNGAAFRKGREFAAWIGLVPREHSTGGKQKLLGISKRGSSYLRRLFVQGARAVRQFRDKQSPGLSAWLAQLKPRAPQRSQCGVEKQPVLPLPLF